MYNYSKNIRRYVKNINVMVQTIFIQLFMHENIKYSSMNHSLPPVSLKNIRKKSLFVSVSSWRFSLQRLLVKKKLFTLSFISVTCKFIFLEIAEKGWKRYIHITWNFFFISY